MKLLNCSMRYNLTITLALFLLASQHGFAQGTFQQQPAPVTDAPGELPENMKPVIATYDRIGKELKSYGIADSSDAMISYLEKGPSSLKGFPDQPEEKSQVVIDLMVRLGERKVKEAVPVLMKIASYDNSVGAFKLVEYDVSKTSPDSREQFRIKAYRLLQYNAINALSLISDPRATGLVRKVLQQEQGAGAQIQYSLCLASLGDASGVDYLVRLIVRQNRRESAAAAKAFTIITGQDFGYTENTPVRARRNRAEFYRTWWLQNRSTFRVDPEKVLERRKNPPGQTTYAPRSTRDLLKLAANYFDFDNSQRSADARKTIQEAGRSLNSDFEKLAMDPMEDLDVRREAMNWYFEANRSDPAGILKKLRKDENPEIVDKANTLLQQIDEESNRGVVK